MKFPLIFASVYFGTSLLATTYTVTSTDPTAGDGIYAAFTSAVAGSGNTVQLDIGNGTTTLSDGVPLATLSNSVSLTASSTSNQPRISAFASTQTIFNIDAGNSLTFGSTGTTRLIGVIAGDGSVVINPGTSGIVDYNGANASAGANTYSGGTSLLSGTLNVGFFGKIPWDGTQTITFNGGTLKSFGFLTFTNPVSMTGDGFLFNNGGATMSFSGAFSGSGSLNIDLNNTVTGGITTLSGNSSAGPFSGATTVWNDQLVIAHNNALGGSGGGTLTVASGVGGATLVLNSGISIPNTTVINGILNITNATLGAGIG